MNQEHEIKKFNELATKWWDINGPMKPLHRFNPARIKFISDSIVGRLGLDNLSSKPLLGLNVLDVGCGGGIVSESIAKLGANVTGIDLSENMIKIAKLHAEQSNLNISYIQTSIENLILDGKKFDIVLGLEVIEHVDNQAEFMKNLTKLSNKMIFVSTINRTIKAYMQAIVAAEYILSMLPKKTHEYNSFVKPSEIVEMLLGTEFFAVSSVGIKYNIFADIWSLDYNDMNVNYIMSICKNNLEKE